MVVKGDRIEDALYNPYFLSGDQIRCGESRRAPPLAFVAANEIGFLFAEALRVIQQALPVSAAG